MTLAAFIVGPLAVYFTLAGVTLHVLRRRAGTWSVDRNGQPHFKPAYDQSWVWLGAAVWPFVVPAIAGLALATRLLCQPPREIRDEVDRRRLAELERELELGA